MPETTDDEEPPSVTAEDIEIARVTIWELNMSLWGMAQDDEYIIDLIAGRDLNTTLKYGYSKAVQDRMRMLDERPECGEE